MTARGPRIRSGAEYREQDRRGRFGLSWLDISFDLVSGGALVVIVLVGPGDASAGSMAPRAALFVALLWAWAGQVLYAASFESDDAVHYVLTSVQAAAILAAAVLARGVIGDPRTYAAFFAIAYAASRIVVVFLYDRTLRRAPGERKPRQVYLLGYGAGAVAWLVSAAVPGSGRYALWALGLGVDWAAALVGRRVERSATRVQPEALQAQRGYLARRVRFFGLIVCGWALIALARVVEERRS